MPKTKLKKSRSPRRKRPVMSMVDPNRVVYQPKYRHRSTSSKRRKRKLKSFSS